MIVLALESATDLVGAAILGEDAPGPAVTETGGRRHAEALAPALRQVCRDAGVSLGDVDVIAVDVGPGLFTGLRVGVATAKALGQGLGIGVVGIESLDILAAAALSRRPARSPCQVVAVVDARRSEVFAARYRFDGATPSTWDPAHDQASPAARFEPQALVDELGRSADDGPLVLVGNGVARYRALFDQLPSVEPFPGAPLDAPPPETLARLARLRLQGGLAASDPADILPHYLREADATINWEQRVPMAASPPSPRGAAPPTGRVP
ncbi:MAG TPA: tRNA (adenosine(37)-N6)-threonylcarbamoyltransferase complex dimerization subunit type 1 TsaB [Acidimicrobiales bacterium]|nr:tRNA (adenosine(37)-N6)-threonylcarbamoyltransferase complex dimerization subunit type 1 TsaB [Acidimicrobiales bacterium]